MRVIPAKGGEFMATLIRWSPFTEINSMDRSMRRVLEGIGFAPLLLPAADVYETEDEFVVELEVPGYEEKELGIEVTDHTVTVRGERKETKEETEKTFRLHERLEREFERRFELPIDADTKHVKATFDNGVLELHTPKLSAPKPQKVAIAKR
jgi:HSP20 family protein